MLAGAQDREGELLPPRPRLREEAEGGKQRADWKARATTPLGSSLGGTNRVRDLGPDLHTRTLCATACSYRYIGLNDTNSQ